MPKFSACLLGVLLFLFFFMFLSSVSSFKICCLFHIDDIFKEGRFIGDLMKRVTKKED